MKTPIFVLLFTCSLFSYAQVKIGNRLQLKQYIMKASKIEFNISEKHVLKKIEENPEYYENRDNAVSNYNLILNNYELIQFKSSSEKADFEGYINELRKVISIKRKELFSQKFAEVTCKIVASLKNQFS